MREEINRSLKAFEINQEPVSKYKYKRDKISKRAVELAKYMVEERCTVREAAESSGVSKSTVHKDVTERLEKIDKKLFNEVQEVLKINLKERSMRAGAALKRKHSTKDISF